MSETVSSTRLESLLEAFSEEIRPETITITAHWKEGGIVERKLFTVKGPALSSAVQELRSALLRDPNSPDTRILAKRVDDILFDDEVVLAAGAVVGCGCLHT